MPKIYNLVTALTAKIASYQIWMHEISIQSLILLSTQIGMSTDNNAKMVAAAAESLAAVAAAVESLAVAVEKVGVNQGNQYNTLCRSH